MKKEPDSAQASRQTGRPGLTVAEVAAELRTHVATVYRWVGSGQLSGIRVGRTVRIKAADLLRLGVTPPTPAGPERMLKVEEQSLEEQPSPGDGASLTLDEAAARLQVGKRTMARLVSKGLLPVVRLSRKMVRVEVSALDAFIEQRKAPPS